MYHLKHFSNKDCLVSILTRFSVVTGHVMDECMGLPKEKQGEVSFFLNMCQLNPLGDQDRISPYTINTISSRRVMRMMKNIN